MKKIILWDKKLSIKGRISIWYGLFNMGFPKTGMELKKFCIIATTTNSERIHMIIHVYWHKVSPLLLSSIESYIKQGETNSNYVLNIWCPIILLSRPTSAFLISCRKSNGISSWSRRECDSCCSDLWKLSFVQFCGENWFGWSWFKRVFNEAYELKWNSFGLIKKIINFVSNKRKVLCFKRFLNLN